MVPEAPLDETEFGLVPTGEGWFMLNARAARWFDRQGRGMEVGLQGREDFWQVGYGLYVLAPGEPMAMYHWETDQEDFLVLSGEALLVVEGEERPLRQWDFFAVGTRERHTYRDADGVLHETDDWGACAVDEAALRHGAGVEEETPDANAAYARFPDAEPMRYRDGWLPPL